MTNDHRVALRVTTDPWTDLDRLFDDLRGNVFGPLGLLPQAPAWAAPLDASGRFRSATTDVTDTGTAYRVTAEIPGIPKDRLEIRVRGTSVEIRGEASATAESRPGDWLHRERTYAGFYRAFELPEPVVGAQAKATVKDGVLELELPKQTPTPSPDEVKVPVQ